MTATRGRTAASTDEGHWISFDERVQVRAGRARKVTVTVCRCGWESTPQRVTAIATEAGLQHVRAHDPKLW